MGRKTSQRPAWYSLDDSIVDRMDSSVDIDVENAVLCLTRGFLPAFEKCMDKRRLKPAPRSGRAVGGKVDFSGILVISDELHSGTWLPRFNSPDVDRSERIACRVAESLFL